jgi:hypothetical protein
MRWLLEFFAERKGWWAIGASVILYVITLILWSGGTFWPFGFMMATVLGLVGLFLAK